LWLLLRRAGPHHSESGKGAKVDPRSRSKKWKELLHLLLFRLAAVLANLEGFRVSDLFPALFPIELTERGAGSVGRGCEECRPLVADGFLSRSHRGRVGRVRDQVGSSVA